MNLNADTIRLLSVLVLLKQEPKRFIELWKSGCFKREGHLRWAIYRLLDLQFIDKLGTTNYRIYAITGMGLKFLQSYPTFDFERVKAEQNGIIQPSLGSF